MCSLFNMQKAFDAVPHQAELAKLHSLGVDNYLLKWICHYLMVTSCLNGACSESSAVLPGVPHAGVSGGSPAIPDLF